MRFIGNLAFLVVQHEVHRASSATRRDYSCAPHEVAGMVGRIVVGQPSGPGALPFDYFKGRPGTREWKPVPLTA